MTTVTRDDAVRWLAAYVAAWRSYDAHAIGDLFSEDAEYRFHAWDEPRRGRAAIVASWLDPANRDEPGTWSAHYEPWAVDGDRVVATGTSSYDDAQGPRTYSNVFLCEFDEAGRCRRFTEVYARQP